MYDILVAFSSSDRDIAASPVSAIVEHNFVSHGCQHFEASRRQNAQKYVENIVRHHRISRPRKPRIRPALFPHCYNLLTAPAPVIRSHFALQNSRVHHDRRNCVRASRSRNTAISACKFAFSASAASNFVCAESRSVRSLSASSRVGGSILDCVSIITRTVASASLTALTAACTSGEGSGTIGDLVYACIRLHTADMLSVFAKPSMSAFNEALSMSHSSTPSSRLIYWLRASHRRSSDGQSVVSVLLAWLHLPRIWWF